MKIYIYQIWFPISKKSYIGQTAYLERRMQEHFKSGSLVCKALWKYDDWQVTILHTCKIRDEANRIEIEEIRNFKSIAPNGYNLSGGGEGFHGKHSEEAKEKNRQAHLGKKASKETIEKLRKASIGNKRRQGYKHSEESKKKMGHPGNKPFKGYHHSEESKEKLRKAHQGKHPEITKRNKENNPMNRIDVKIKRLKTRIKKLEQELN